MRKRALLRKKCKQPGLKQPGLGTADHWGQSSYMPFFSFSVILTGNLTAYDFYCYLYSYFYFWGN